MGVDLCVVGQVRGSDVDYSAPLHAQPNYDAMERPCYGMDDLWRLKWGSNDMAIFDTSLDYLGNRSLVMFGPICMCLVFDSALTHPLVSLSRG